MWSFRVRARQGERRNEKFFFRRELEFLTKLGSRPHIWKNGRISPVVWTPPASDPKDGIHPIVNVQGGRHAEITIIGLFKLNQLQVIGMCSVLRSWSGSPDIDTMLAYPPSVSRKKLNTSDSSLTCITQMDPDILRSVGPQRVAPAILKMTVMGHKGAKSLARYQ